MPLLCRAAESATKSDDEPKLLLTALIFWAQYPWYDSPSALSPDKFSTIGEIQI
jgi:hypothetical protein